MSAMTATIQKHRIVMLTDACFYLEDGTLAFLDRKAHRVPGLKCAAYSSRGVNKAFDYFREACDAHHFADWRDFLRKVESVWAHFDSQMAKITPHAAEIMICGWNEERDRGEVLFRFTHNKDLGPLKPNVTYFALEGHFRCLPGNPEMGDPELFDPASDGIPAFERARRDLHDLRAGTAANGTMGHSVGGWIDVTEISPAGVTINTIHHWPDRVGSKIVPDSDLAKIA